MTDSVKKVVVLGGGSAGWLTANRIAAEHFTRGLEVTLVESPDIPTIGVGEGTWPSMRNTLQQIGFPEDELLACCDASFKQGTSFVGWQGQTAHTYLHPFSKPAEYPRLSLARYWLAAETSTPFAEFVCPQAAVINQQLAPKQVRTPPYAFNVNYAYHLDAGRFAERLRDHAVQRLGVRHIRAKVASIASDPQGDIASLQLEGGDAVPGDLFVDCSGSRALLLGEHYGIPNKPAGDMLFNDRAIAVQVPHESEQVPLASTTLATARAAGWIWDIALTSRRGLGHVYSSAHLSDEAAMETLKDYVRHSTDPDKLSYKALQFEPGYKARPWVNNCVAVGMAAGFVEPLEASALALVEQAAAMLADQLPRDRALMNLVAERFNRKMLHHWERIVEFLKLHYYLSERSDSAYWLDHRQEASCPPSLLEKLQLWQQQPPGHDDAPGIEELFPAASYQYILYGMGFQPRYSLAEGSGYARERQRADKALHQVVQDARQLTSALPSNRDLLAAKRQAFNQGEDS